MTKFAKRLQDVESVKLKKYTCIGYFDWTCNQDGCIMSIGQVFILMGQDAVNYMVLHNHEISVHYVSCHMEQHFSYRTQLGN